jgi:hypothetical protein
MQRRFARNGRTTTSKHIARAWQRNPESTAIADLADLAGPRGKFPSARATC